VSAEELAAEGRRSEAREPNDNGGIWNWPDGSLGLDWREVSGGVLKASSAPKSVSLDDLVPGRIDKPGESGGL
jgi:hypothetical protein